MTGWKPQSLTDLVEKLYTEVRAQYEEVERAMVIIGDLQLTSDFTKYELPLSRWKSMSKEKHVRHLKRYYKK